VNVIGVWLMCDLRSNGICFKGQKPVALRYWYKSVTGVTVRAGRLAVGRVPPGGMVQQRP